MNNFLWVGVGGFLGSTLRYSVGLLCSGVSLQNFPFPTFLVNVLGALILGALMAVGQSRIGENTYLLLVPGLLGGFTTYSTYSGETFHLIRQQLYLAASVYVILTFIVGLLAVALGYYGMKSLS